MVLKSSSKEKSSDGNTAKYAGWSSEGIVEYKRILKRVEQDRGRSKDKFLDSVDKKYMIGC